MTEPPCGSTSTIDVIPVKAEIHSAVTISDAMKIAQRQIDLVDARVLLQHALQINRAYLAAHPEVQLTEEQQNRFDAFVERRKHGEPIAYITGEREFYGLPFKVTPAVLIPRPETEILVDQVLAHISQHRSARILDLGTGSGAIAIAIAQHRPNAKIVAIDSSLDALGIAANNAQQILRERATAITFLQSNWFSVVPNEPFDVIVSNPPYIDENDPHLAQGDLRFEPINALAAGPRGLEALARIARNAAPYLARGGWLMMEHGYDQRQACSEFLIAAGFDRVQALQDLAGIDRVTIGQWPAN